MVRSTDGEGAGLAEVGVKQQPGAGVLLVLGLAALSWAPVLKGLWPYWVLDPYLSHGRLVPPVVLLHLWLQRKWLTRWEGFHPRALLLVLPSAGLYLLGALTGDLFLWTWSALGLTAGAAWFCGGPRKLRIVAGALGMMLLTTPWPADLDLDLAHRLQLSSSALSAMLGGLFGLPITRHDIVVSIIPNQAAPPVFSMIVAEHCSGFSSLFRFLWIGYLVAYHTPVSAGWRALLVAASVPLTVAANTARLTLVLLIAAHVSPKWGMWYHDHEAPFRQVVCSLVLLGMRQALLAWLPKGTRREDSAPEPLRQAAGSRRAAFGLAALLALVLLAGLWGQHRVSAPGISPSALTQLPLGQPGWSVEDRGARSDDALLVRPDALLIRRYESKTGDSLELAVAASAQGIRVPHGFQCTAETWWEDTGQWQSSLKLEGGSVPLSQSVLANETGERELMTYFYVGPRGPTRSLLGLRLSQWVALLRGAPSQGAMVRVKVAIKKDLGEADGLTRDYLARNLPILLGVLRSGGR
ncbi:MAG TPA: exosortase/archaeosortase family protein [Armatimonadota bacterium]|jgi:exosortase